MKRVHLIIEGRVQGVGYRVSLMQEGQRLGLVGWVRNLPDGNVEAVVEGASDQLEKLIAWCHKGPPMAYVTEVKTTFQEATGEFKGFEVGIGGRNFS